MTEIKQELITKALLLTNKPRKFVDDWGQGELFGDDGDIDLEYGFSIERFFYYLLSPEFIDKCINIDIGWEFIGDRKVWLSSQIGIAIYEYQSGNIEPLTQLLKKI